jgi:argininosuccinate synthase
MKQRIVLAYDGSPDGSAAISWLGEHHQADVVTLTLDVGNGMALDGLRDQSLGRGAIRAHVLEVHEEFAREVVIPAAQAGTFGPGTSLTTLVRPLLARKLVDVARIEKASAVAVVSYGGEAAGMEGMIAVLDPALSVIVKGAGRDDRPLPPQRKSVASSSVIATPAQVEIAFKDGVPSTINGITMRLPELLESLATIASEHGIAGGEHAFAPAATVLHAAYVALTPSTDGVVRLKLSHGACTVCEDVKLGM